MHATVPMYAPTRDPDNPLTDPNYDPANPSASKVEKQEEEKPADAKGKGKAKAQPKKGSAGAAVRTHGCFTASRRLAHFQS